jgi:exonuclease VII small subunit
MGGFKEGAQAYRRCRECMATLEDLISKVFLILNCDVW